MQKYLKAFVIGLSLIVFIWPLSVAYGTVAVGSDLVGPFSVFAVQLGLAIGASNALYLALKKQLPGDRQTSYWIFGLLFGLLLSLYGVFVANWPSDLLKMATGLQWLFAPIAVIASGLLWRYVMAKLNRLFGLDRH